VGDSAGIEAWLFLVGVNVGFCDGLGVGTGVGALVGLSLGDAEGLHSVVNISVSSHIPLRIKSA
jgi:hypothetical protein